MVEMYGFEVMGQVPVLHPMNRWYARPTAAPIKTNQNARTVMCAWSHAKGKGFAEPFE
jgi:hypothetical protein